MNNEDIADLLNIYAQLVSLHGGNSFKVSSYQTAAFNIKKKTPQILSTLSEDELMLLPQLGKGISSKIAEINTFGSFKDLDILLEQTPKGVAEMLQIRGLGPKKVQIIWKEMGIDTVGELMDACRQNRLAKTKGFGEKTQEQVLAAMEFTFAMQDKKHWAKLAAFVHLIDIELNKLIGNNSFFWVGDFARKLEILDRLELLIEDTYKRAVVILLNNLGLGINQLEGNTYQGFIDEKFPFYIYFEDENDLGWQQYIRTTPLEVQQKIAIKKANASNEKSLFESQNVSFVEPELREPDNIVWMHNEMQLITVDNLKGCLHNHTTYSDGMNSLAEMAQACIDQNLSYFGVCDHSKTAGYASGLQVDAVQKQWKEIDALNKTYKDFKIFKGIESDILSDGSLDYESDILAGFDFVVASIHSNLKMDKEKAMMRLITAIENPFTRIIGHLTGRLLLMRDGYPVDHLKIIDACAANNVAIELNAHPYRLDMDWRYIHYAIEKGVLISINPDAHVTNGIMDMQYGVNVARKAGLEAKNCLNAMNTAEFEKWILAK